MLGFVVLRLLPVPAVFRGGDVVYLGNDPYAYIHVIDRVVMGTIPLISESGYGLGEPLLIAMVSLVSRVFGGGYYTELIFALYPVLVGVVVAVLTYGMGRELTSDARIAIASVVFLAVTPINISRTAVGFSDHHPFDLLWVTVIGALLTWLLARPTAPTRTRYVLGSGLGVGIAAQTLAWEASPLLLAPVAVALGLGSLVSIERQPRRVFGPIVFGFGVGSGLVQLAHYGFGWGSSLVAAIPVLLFFGGSVLWGLLEVTRRVKGSWSMLLFLELLVALIALVGIWVVQVDLTGDISTRMAAGLEYFARHATTDIGETNPVAGEFGPIRGFTILLGFAPFLGLPVLPWAFANGWNRREAAWFVPAVYLGWFLGLSFIQRRFAVHLTPFLAVFAGIGFVVLAEWFDILQVQSFTKGTGSNEVVEDIQPPERERLAVLGGMALVGTGFSAAISSNILSRLSIDTPSYQAAAWIRGYADSLGLAYPENYVLAEWGRVRMYNRIVNGHSRSYGYARERYEEFLTSNHPDDWYEEFAGRVGFVITRDYGDVSPTSSLGLLHDEYGSRTAFVPGVSHFRAVWESADGSVKVFSIVPGATLRGTASPDTELDVEVTVQLAPRDTEFRYQKSVEVGGDGEFSLTVAHPGEYTVGDTRVTVPESAVHVGEVIFLGSGTP